MEEEPMTEPGHDDNDVGLAQILAEVVEEVRLSIDRDINGADLLYGLLSAPWLYSLLRVYECLVQHSQDAPRPCMPYSSRLSQEIMASVRGLAAPSSEAQELYILLKWPHMQALLSAHDSVAQRNYGPVLPPLPDTLPDNEEAMRIVCLVKNKQPLCVREGKPSYWNSLRRITVEKLALARRFGSGEQSLLGSADGLSSSTGLLSSIPPGKPHSLPRYQSTGSCNLCCQTAHLSGGGLNLSAPAVYDSVIMDGVETHTCTACTASSLVYPRSCCPSGCGLHSQTAPSSPLLQRHNSIDATRSSHPAPVFKKQHSLDELRSTIHAVASSMDSSTSDAQDLRQKMVATERMTDSMEENAQALSLLVEVVDKLQGLIITSKSPEGATIRKNEKTGNIFIARVIHGGLADRSGLLHPGDKLVEVNGQKVQGLQPEHVIQILVRSQGNILFKVIPNSPQPINSRATLYVRAMEDYSPLQDPAIPCPDAGMAFSKGDLLEIVDQRDIQWWQARKLNSASLCCGLIPSTNQFRSSVLNFAEVLSK
ncbi:MAGUK p55 subfamily member 4 [Anabarilius grahami]|uniref:MAGUK p55 subfamily member 4 n=1 Tax=Anabarilius grahami TaxID=495550 RepID=A0A3N0XVB0_ANAGA|nr:MAGUK p55 subfamily member 4 [Anabarilius grahami]